MFYCKHCEERLKYPSSIVKSFGQCELCGSAAFCSDIPSSRLPRKIAYAPFIKKLKKLKNKQLKLEEELEKINEDIKVGDKVSYLYYKTFKKYKIKEATVVALDVSTYDETYDFRIKFKNGKTSLADKEEVQLM